MKKIKIYADFNNADPSGRLRLICTGTIEALQKHNIDLMEGMSLVFTDNEGLEGEGLVSHSKEENIWVATIDWNKLTKQ